MKKSFSNLKFKIILPTVVFFLTPLLAAAQNDTDVSFFPHKSIQFIDLLITLVVVTVIAIAILLLKLISNTNKTAQDQTKHHKSKFKQYISTLNATEIDVLKRKRNDSKKSLSIVIVGFLYLLPQVIFAQSGPAKREDVFSEPGVVITLVLIFIPLAFALVYLVSKVTTGFRNYNNFQKVKEAEAFASFISDDENMPSDAELEEIKEKSEYTVVLNEISAGKPAHDSKGLLKNITS
jgi:cytochrome c oxidase cbb3-type subunit 1